MSPLHILILFLVHTDLIQTTSFTIEETIGTTTVQDNGSNNYSDNETVNGSDIGTTSDPDNGIPSDQDNGSTSNTEIKTNNDSDIGTTSDLNNETTSEPRNGITSGEDDESSSNTAIETSNDSDTGTTSDPNNGITSDQDNESTNNPDSETTNNSRIGTTSDPENGANFYPHYGTNSYLDNGTTNDPDNGVIRDQDNKTNIEHDLTNTGQDADAVTNYILPLYNLTYINDCSMKILGNCSILLEFCDQFKDVMLTAMNYTCYPAPITEYEAKLSCRKYLQICKDTENKNGIMDESCENIERLFIILNITSNLWSKYPFDNIPNEPEIETKEGAILPDYSEYVQFLAILRQRISDAEKLLPGLFSIIDYFNETGLAGIFKPEGSSDFLKIYKVKYVAEDLNKIVDSNDGIEILYLTTIWIFPIISIFECLIGVTGNGLLLAIFILNKNMRGSNNVMLINLAVVDIISLTVNLPISVIAITKSWWSNMPFCIIQRFLMNFSVFISTYCVVFLGFQRYYAVSNITSVTSHKSKLIIRLATPIIWLLGTFYGFLHVVNMEIPKGSSICSVEEPFFRYLSITNFIVICVSPVIVISIFYIFTTLRIRKSVCKFPGNKTENMKQLNDRSVATRILIGLLILFIISYIPNGIFHVLGENGLIFNQVLTNNEIAVFLTLLLGTNNMLFLNSTLHPVLLYFLSRKFRMCYKSLFCCSQNNRGTFSISETKNTHVSSIPHSGTHELNDGRYDFKS